MLTLLARMALFLFAFLAMPIAMPSATLAQSVDQATIAKREAGSVIKFTEGDFILRDGLDFPNEGWERRPNPNIYRMNETQWRFGDYHSLSGRFRFDRSDIQAENIALYTISTRNNFRVLVNDLEVFRNFGTSEEQKNTWYRPFLIPLPADALKQGQNELVIEAYSQESLAIGQVWVGPQASLQNHYGTKFFWQITAPSTANFAMLFVGLLVFLFWLGRRQEIELLWLSVSTVLWFLRNYQYYAEQAPFSLPSFWLNLFTTLPVHASYFATAATAAFYLCFTKTRHRHMLIAGMFGLGAVLVGIFAFFISSDLVLYIPTTIIVLGISTLGFINLNRYRNIEHGILGFTMMATPLATLYDLYAAIEYQGDGRASYAAIFGGLFYTTAFIISFGKRALDAFTDLGASNILLEKGIAQTRAELAESEAARQELLVEQTLASERGRLMQEMHDGIGSNLITALAVARQQDQPPSTIKTLNRALNDLKITVDSLEPIEGDLIALIGNLRHRMAGDLRDAGIACQWEVEDCKPLTWLDASNALHVLRIMQEAIGNVLSHSQASQLTIGCKERSLDGASGIATYVIDNGRGFSLDGESYGKGLSNMQARAQSLHGSLECEAKPNEGCAITLWLPYERHTETR
ncbi:MAG: ATP-binding protein [Erythrobacter sp.]